MKQDDTKQAADRPFGSEKDRIAANQLGLAENYSIFMMGVDIVEHVDEDEFRRAIERAYDENGIWDATDVNQILSEHLRQVKIPKGWAMVGMSPLGVDQPAVYGLVDFAASPQSEGA